MEDQIGVQILAGLAGISLGCFLVIVGGCCLWIVWDFLKEVWELWKL